MLFSKNNVAEMNRYFDSKINLGLNMCKEKNRSANVSYSPN